MSNRHQIQEELRDIHILRDHQHPIPLPYTVPEGYFNQLETALLAKLPKGHLNPVDPLPANTGNPAYRVPEQYFAQLETTLLQRVRHLAHPKNLSIPITRKVFRYAAAAVTAGMILTTAWFYRNEPLNTPTPSLASTPVIPDSMAYTELQQFLDLEDHSITPSDEELASLLTAAIPNETMPYELLADVSDSELEAFINNQTSTSHTWVN